MTSSAGSAPDAPALRASSARGLGGRWRSARQTVRSGLTSLAVLGVSGAALGGVYAGTGLGIPCPLKLATGWDCPLCGGTRMAAALLHGDVTAAFVYNPLALIGLVVAVLLGVAWLAELFGAPRWRLPRSLGRRIAGVPGWGWWVVGLTVTVGYMLLRNLAWPIPA